MAPAVRSGALAGLRGALRWLLPAVLRVRAAVRIGGLLPVRVAVPGSRGVALAGVLRATAPAVLLSALLGLGVPLLRRISVLLSALGVALLLPALLRVALLRIALVRVRPTRVRRALGVPLRLLLVLLGILRRLLSVG